MLEQIIPAALTAMILSVVFYIFHRRAQASAFADAKDHMNRANAAEKILHLKEMEYLEERNKAIVAQTEEVYRAKELAFEEGRKRGIAESELDCAKLLAAKRSEFGEKLRSEVESAAADAQAKMKADYELQTKLFSLKVSPLVKKVTNKGFISDSYDIEVGFQYQLLVNGVPAFQPHVIIEHKETVKEVNEQKMERMIALASDILDAAVSTYCGPGHRFVIRSNPIRVG